MHKKRNMAVHPFLNPPPTIQLSPIKLPANQPGHTKHLSLKVLGPGEDMSDLYINKGQNFKS